MIESWTREKIEKLARKSENSMEKDNLQWLLQNESCFDSLKEFFEQLNQYGCSSGMIHDLIYTRDCMQYVETYKEEINEFVFDFMESTGVGRL